MRKVLDEIYEVEWELGGNFGRLNGRKLFQGSLLRVEVGDVKDYRKEENL